MVDSCGNITAPCHTLSTDESSVTDSSHCPTTKFCNNKSSLEESVSKPAKCSNPDTVSQKTSKELAKVKKREDKGIGRL